LTDIFDNASPVSITCFVIEDRPATTAAPATPPPKANALDDSADRLFSSPFSRLIAATAPVVSPVITTLVLLAVAMSVAHLNRKLKSAPGV